MVSKKQLFNFGLIIVCTISSLALAVDTSTLQFQNNTDEPVFASFIDKGDATVLQKNMEKGRIEIAPHRSYDLITVRRGSGSSEDVYKIAITDKNDKFITGIYEKIEHEFLDSDVFAAIVPKGANPVWIEVGDTPNTSRQQVTNEYTTYTIDQSFSGDNPIFQLSSKTLQYGEPCITKSNRQGIFTSEGCVHSCKTEFGADGLLGSLKNPKDPNKKQCFPYTQQSDEKTKTTTEGFLDVNDEFLPLCRTATSNLGFLDEEKTCKPYCVTEYGENGTVSADGKTCTPFGGTAAVTEKEAPVQQKSTAQTGRTSRGGRNSRGASGKGRARG